MTLNWPVLLAVAAVLAIVIGGGGFTIGMAMFYDRGWRDRDRECEQHHHADRPPARYDPADPWRTGRHERPGPPWSAELDPATAPMRLRALVARVGAWLPPVPAHHGPTTPDALAAAVAIQGQRTELEIAELARQAEEHIGRIKERVRAELEAPDHGRTPA